MCSLSGSGGAAPSPRQTTTTLHKSDSSLESTSGGMPSPELLQTVWFCEYFCVSHVHVSPTCWCVQKRLCFRPNSSPHCPNCRVGSTVHLHGEHVVPGSHAPLGNDPCAPWTFSFFLSFFLLRLERFNSRDASHANSSNYKRRCGAEHDPTGGSHFHVCCREGAFSLFALHLFDAV